MITRIQNYSLQDIKNSINYLLDKAAVSPEVRALALEVTLGQDDQVAAIYDWAKAKVRYISDPIDKELFISPVRMVLDYRNGLPIAGDCDDMAILTTALCRSIGIQSNVVLIDQTGNRFDHAYCQIMTKLGMTNVDPSSKYPLGWEVKYKQKIVV